MPRNLYWITAAHPYRLATVARPRGHDWLAEEIEGLSRDGINTLVSMLTTDEAAELGLIEEKNFCKETGVQFFNFPIEDRSLPDENEIPAMLDMLAEEVKSGRAVGFHCRAGIGRSSMMAALVLSRLGWTSQAAFQAISESRGCKVPDTLEQEQWVRDFVGK
jgi:protein-tyrosine phosphatase